MKKLGDHYIAWVEKYLPSPFIIALILTGITFILALFTYQSDASLFGKSMDIVGFWQKGFWELLAFTMQMTLILLLGHTLAMTPLFKKLINYLADASKNTAQAALIVCFFTLLISFINWGLCVIFGAILSKKIADRFAEKGKPINLGLTAAAGYVGMMAWHGGLSGSAPLKVAESDHFLVDQMGSLSIQETILSPMNLSVGITLLIVLPIFCYWMGKQRPGKVIQPTSEEDSKRKVSQEGLEGNSLFGKSIGAILLVSGIIYAFIKLEQGQNIIDLNYINYSLLSLSILFHKSLAHFFSAATEGIKGVVDVVIQFPIYAGIMGIMKYSGLVIILSEFFVNISSETSFPIFTFFSAAIVNFFVPSGGGQWAIQGPIMIETANSLGISAHKIVMAVAYGDQITNMLQPFWALPLLGITGLKAKEILPYTTLFFIIGGIIFIGALLLF